MAEISKELNGSDIIQLEYLDNKNAVAFYKFGSVFGHALVKKNIFGWKSMNVGTTDYKNNSSDRKLGWSFDNLEYEEGIKITDLLKGNIIDDDIKEVIVITEDGKEHLAEIITNGGERFWYLLSKNRDLNLAIVKGISETGEVIYEYPEQ